MLLCAACAHGEAGAYQPVPSGPFSPGSDVQLTFNSEQDYWPTWTQDGKGILYSYVDPASPRHRCLGLLPAGGGDRLWQLCDNRTQRDDSVNSYTAYALDRDGHLLYSEALSRGQRPDSVPVSITLWLADTAAPLRRTALLSFNTFPLAPNSWLGDIRWTGPASFLALGQSLEVARPFLPPKDQPLRCAFSADSIWYGGSQIMAGVISNNRATLQPIDGTVGATSYAAIEHGTTLVIIRAGSLQLFRVPVAGGSATPLATIPGSSSTLLGIGCTETQCVVASDPVILPPGDCAGPAPGPRQLWGVTIATGAVQLLHTSSDDLLAGVDVSAATGDAVVQFGGVLGHLGTYAAPSNGNLHLFAGLSH